MIPKFIAFALSVLVVGQAFCKPTKPAPKVPPAIVLSEIVELTTVAAFRGLMNRFMDSLHIELEGPELQARGGRAVASREDLHAYVEKLVNLV